MYAVSCILYSVSIGNVHIGTYLHTFVFYGKENGNPAHRTQSIQNGIGLSTLSIYLGRSSTSRSKIQERKKQLLTLELGTWNLELGTGIFFYIRFFFFFFNSKHSLCLLGLELNTWWNCCWLGGMGWMDGKLGMDEELNQSLNNFLRNFVEKYEVIKVCHSHIKYHI